MAVATETRCNGCGAGISEWEEGRCAFCRAEDRGDDQLLAHDSRGYLDVDGKTRIPCGCGCRKPVIVPESAPEQPEPADDIEKLRDLIGHGQKVEIRLPQEPVSWRREWIERLGGVIVIDPSAPMPLAMQRDKEEPNGNGHADVPPKPEERTEPMQELNQCKIDGCHEEALLTRGRYAYLCAEHKAEKLAEERREKGWHAEPEDDEPEPVEETALVPVPAAPPPIANGSDPESVDVFELFEHMATDERIDYYEAVAAQAQLKAEALRSIREALETVKAVEA